MIPRPFIHDLLNRLDIVDTIDRHVPLKKAGANYVACCPFHSEKTPSFTVSQSKQFYHCFGCGAHGDAINFLIEFSGLSFMEAVRNLAAHMGMPVPEQQPDSDGFVHPSHEEGDARSQGITQDLLEVMKVATKFYRDQLKASEKAIGYLKKRGLTGEVAVRFAIGYAPPDWQNLDAVFTDYRSAKTRGLLADAGLIVVGEDGETQYDRFRDRIMFPILNQKGHIVGFGGRVIEQEEPKYLNSPETKLFEKGRELYNLFAARRAIREAGCVVVVEGYMDVVALSQHGIDYSVAALGTATTGSHIQKLLRQTDKIIFCFDGDQAGNKAAWRALENSLPHLVDGKYLGFLFLPEGEDPDSYVLQFGKRAFEEQLKKTTPLSEFLFHELTQDENLQSSEGRAKLVKDIKPLLKQIKAPALILMLLKRLSEISGVGQRELEELLQVKRGSESLPRKSVPRKAPVTPYHWLILALLSHPAYVSQFDESLLEDGYGADHEERMALKLLVEFLSMHPDIIEDGDSASILTYLPDSPYRTLFESIESEILEWKEPIDLDAEFSGAIHKLQEMKRKQRMTELHSKSLNILTEEEKQELKRLAML